MLVVIASVLLVGATVTGYARLALFDSQQFANRASAALAEPAVRTAIGDRVTDEVVLRNDADLIAARPLIASAVSGIVGGGAFRSLFRRAVLDAHRAIFTGDRDTLTLTLADVSTVVAAALEKLNPQLADDLDAGERVVLLKRDLGSLTADVVRTGERLQVLAWVLAALTLAAAGAALVFSPDRRRTSSQLGIGVAAAGLTIVIAYTVARALLVDGAAAGVWDAYLGDLRAFGWVLDRRGRGRRRRRGVADRADRDRGPAARGVADRDDRAAHDLAAARARRHARRGGHPADRAAAGGAADRGHARRRLRALQGARDRPAHGLPPGGGRRGDAGAGAAGAAPAAIAVPVLAALLIAVAVTAFALGGGTEAPAQPVTACNGAAALCDRPLDEVVMPATHNSMSVPLPGWYSAEQERPIGGQLEDGIRGLLLDTHYGDRLASGRVRTYFGSAEQRREAATQDGVSPEAVSSALRLRERLGFRGEGTRGMYLCHSFCELGATPLADGLDDIHEFLVTPPGRGRRGHQPGLRDARGLRRRRSMTPGSRATPPRSASSRGRRCAR